MDPIPPTIEWQRGRVRLIDQRALPGELRFVECATVDELWDAITSLAVRGAPALGAAGAFGSFGVEFSASLSGGTFGAGFGPTVRLPHRASLRD